MIDFEFPNSVVNVVDRTITPEGGQSVRFKTGDLAILSALVRNDQPLTWEFIERECLGRQASHETRQGIKARLTNALVELDCGIHFYIRSADEVQLGIAMPKTLGKATVDARKHTLMYDGNAIRFSDSGWLTLADFVAHMGIVRSFDDIRNLRGNEVVDGSIKTFLNTAVTDKLRALGAGLEVQNVRSLGYRLLDPPDFAVGPLSGDGLRRTLTYKGVTGSELPLRIYMAIAAVALNENLTMPKRQLLMEAFGNGELADSTFEDEAVALARRAFKEINLDWALVGRGDNATFAATYVQGVKRTERPTEITRPAHAYLAEAPDEPFVEWHAGIPKLCRVLPSGSMLSVDISSRAFTLWTLLKSVSNNEFVDAQTGCELIPGLAGGQSYLSLAASELEQALNEVESQWTVQFQPQIGYRLTHLSSFDLPGNFDVDPVRRLVNSPETEIQLSVDAFKALGYLLAQTNMVSNEEFTVEACERAISNQTRKTILNEIRDVVGNFYSDFLLDFDRYGVELKIDYARAHGLDRLGDLRVSVKERQLKSSAGERVVNLAAVRLIAALVDQPGVVHTFENLAKTDWGAKILQRDMAINATAKLAAPLKAQQTRWHLQTVWGVGLRMLEAPAFDAMGVQGDPVTLRFSAGNRRSEPASLTAYLAAAQLLSNWGTPIPASDLSEYAFGVPRHTSILNSALREARSTLNSVDAGLKITLARSVGLVDAKWETMPSSGLKGLWQHARSRMGLTPSDIEEMIDILDGVIGTTGEFQSGQRILRQVPLESETLRKLADDWSEKNPALTLQFKRVIRATEWFAQRGVHPALPTSLFGTDYTFDSWPIFESPSRESELENELSELEFEGSHALL